MTLVNTKMINVTEGFGHGFITLEDNTEVFYQMSEFHTSDSAGEIRWNDHVSNIHLPIEPATLSKHDQNFSDFII